MGAKRRFSVHLDRDLVDELHREGKDLSALVNEALRAEVERRRRERALMEIFDGLDVDEGPGDETGSTGSAARFCAD